MSKPLHVVAHLLEGISVRAPLMLDGLLAWAAASAVQAPTPLRGEELPQIQIPIALAPGGVFHLCSEGFPQQDESEIRHLRRRPVVHEMARFGTPKIRRVDIAGSENKGLQVPYEFSLCKQIEWWCVGDADELRRLLSRVHYLGRFRGSGKGKLDIHGKPWTVEPCEAWPGFPLVRDGKPLRPLPRDWPGLDDPPLAYRVLTYPYYEDSRAELLAVPRPH